MQKITNAILSNMMLMGAFIFSFVAEGWSQTTTTYNDSGNIYSVHAHNAATSTTWTVPPNVTTVTLKVWGGAGGLGGEDCGNGCGNAAGGVVGYLEATYTVTPGDVLGLYPGGKGADGLNSVAGTGGGAGGSSPYNVNYKGGNGGNAAASGTSGGGGGGGAASIVTLNSSIIAVAGGAGGGGGMANVASSGQAGSSATLANGTSNTGGTGASGSSCGKADGGGAGGGGGGQYGSLGGTTYAASAEECAGNGGYRGSSQLTGAQSTIQNSTEASTSPGKVEIVYTPKDLYVDVDATDVNSYSGTGSTWSDLSNYNNDLSLIGSPSYDTGYGGYLEFDGTGSQYAEDSGFYGSGVFIGSSSAPENWNDNSTYEAWVNPASLNTTTPRLVFGDGNNNEGVIDFRSDRIRAWNSDGIVAEYVASIASNRWYHVVMTHERTVGDNYEVKLFLDGIEVASSAGTTTDINYGPDNDLRLGYNWDGAIARAKVYNYLRTETEISDSYDVNKNLYCHFEYTTTVPSGSGTLGDPYLVSNFENLLWITLDNSRWDKHYLQTADIDASVTSEECFNDGLGWSPIGDAVVEFTGSYDGGGFTISNLTINRPTQQNVGLFGVISGATIKNLFLNGTTTAYWEVGGLVGHTVGSASLINNVHTNVDLTVGSSGGGIAGHHQGTIENSSAAGNITGNRNNLGGLVGYNNGGKIYRSFATGNVTDSNTTNGQVGGLVGSLLSGSVLEDCYATGNASAVDNSLSGGVGGLVGRIRVTDVNIVRCYSTGTPSANGGPVGGLVGYNADGSGLNVTDSFWDTQTSGSASSAGGSGLTTANMKLLSNYISASWDFQCESANGTNDYWGANSIDNSGYPFLSWQGYTHDSAVEGGVASTDQSVCFGSTFQPLALTGSNGTIQWQMSSDNVLFADIAGATSTSLDVQALDITEDTWFYAVVTEGTCTDTSNVVSVEVIQPITSSITVSACNSYLAPDGQEYGESGEYSAVIPSASGCDSTITIDLTVNADIEVNISAEACGSYTAPDEAVYTTSGQYLSVLQRSNGCDSLITVELTIHDATSSTISVSSCNTYTAPDGQEYSSSGQYQAVVPNAAGCDSTITINLTISASSLDLSYTAEEATIGFANGAATVAATGGTPPYTYQWNDSFMQTTETLWGVFAGTYECLVTDAAGCSMSIEAYVPLFTGIPDTKVGNSFCGATNLELGDFISCDNVNNADAFRWEFVEQGGTALPEFTRYNSRYIRLQWVSGIEYGAQYDVRVKARVDGEWGTYADTCVIALASVVPTTEVRPEYRPTNAQGNNYELCDFIMAQSIAGAVNYRWRFDPDWDSGNGNEIIYTRNISNPALRLSWVNGLTPGVEYKVAVSVELELGWGEYGNVHPILMGAVVQPEIRSQFCGQTHQPNGYVLSTSVCEADFYKFELKPVGGGTEHYVTSDNYVALFSQVTPSLVPGEYDMRVRTSQGGVLGEYGSACAITIGGPQGMISETPTVRSLNASAAVATIFPNPNAGDRAILSMEGLPTGASDMAVMVFNVQGQQVFAQQFAHQGERLYYPVEFGNNLVSGLYIIHIEVDGQPFSKEKFVVR